MEMLPGVGVGLGARKRLPVSAAAMRAAGSVRVEAAAMVPKYCRVQQMEVRNEV